MSDKIIAVAPNTVVSVSFEDDTEMNPWHVIGDLRAPGSGWGGDENYTVRDALRPMEGVQFDPESSCFYAYATTEEVADQVVGAIKVWMASHNRPLPEEAPPVPYEDPTFTIHLDAMVELTVKDVWPDGDQPTFPTAEDVRAEMEACGRKDKVLRSWALDEDLRVLITNNDDPDDRAEAWP